LQTRSMRKGRLQVLLDAGIAEEDVEANLSVLGDDFVEKVPMAF